MRSVSFDNPVSRSTAAIGSDGPAGAGSPAGEPRRERAEWRLDKINLLRDSVLDKRLTQGTDSLTIGGGQHPPDRAAMESSGVR
jgi:hypothetical protein